MDMTLEQCIADFKSFCEKQRALHMACAMFSWDMSTGAPKGGNPSRAKTMSLLEAEAFSMSVSDEMKGYIDRLESEKDKLDDVTRAMLRICKRDYDSFRKIPVDEMRRYAELVANAGDVWEDAKKEDDYVKFAPVLDEIIQYQIKFVNYRGYEGHPYNTLLDDFEPGMTVDKLDVYFDKLKSKIVPLCKRIREEGKKIDCGFTSRPVSKEKQEKIADLLMEKTGYDLNRGMLKESEHPFTNGFGRNDVRITTNYHEDAFLSSFFSVVHECGHAIYEQNAMDEIEDTILDTGVSMGIHESQSRFYENIIGRSLAFWESIYDEIMAILGEGFKDVTAWQFYEAVNVSEPSLIRIEADELTYSLHIMVRYEIEKTLLTGAYDINDLPRLWNEKMREYLGITPPDNRSGVLQDVHWSGGMLGYFPSYSLGSAYAAQLLHYMQKDIDVFGCVRKGDLAPVTDWLKEKIHRFGSLKTPVELITAIAGEDLNADYYVDYLEEKYKKVYGLS